MTKLRRRALIGVTLGAVAGRVGATGALPSAPPLAPSPAFPPAGSAAARGAVVWLHGAYDTSLPPPAAPPVMRRFPPLGWDVWRFDRTTGHDPLGEGGARLIQGLRGLRTGGYRRIIVGGHSRGAFIALYSVAVSGLADGYLLASPAAHGRSPERRAQAIADFNARMDAAALAPGTRVALLQFAGDDLDPAPAARLKRLRAMTQHTGMRLLSIFEPREPRGHLGVYDGDFDRLFGQELVNFLTN